MRSSSAFFKVFPPPKLMLMPHAGLDVSDDGLSFIAYAGFGSDRHVSACGAEELPPDIFAGGDMKDEKELSSRLGAFARKHGLCDVKVSIPEEKAYLFQTDVPSTDQKAIEQNIEFKLEENVPLSAQDSVFYFDLLPRSVTAGALRASVSVVPRTYIERYTALLGAAGLHPVSFETVPKAVARAVIPAGSDKTRLIIHVMSKKTGLYVVSGNVAHFTFTASWGMGSQGAMPVDELRREIARIRSYWFSHGDGKTIDEAILVGKGADKAEAACAAAASEAGLSVRLADVWANALDLERSIPPIDRAGSLGYAVAAGLAFETPRSS